jgi:hypothetical protein
MGRFEYKYLLDPGLLPALRERFRQFVRIDSHALGREGGRYTIHSIYFDTRALRDYHEKLSGVERRRKLRIRVYNERQAASVAYLEVKRKVGDIITKQRAPLLYGDVGPLLSSGDIAGYIIANDGVSKAVDNARSFFYSLHTGGMIPTVLVTYEREPYVGIFDPGFRLTFDTGLRFASYPAVEDAFRDTEMRRGLEGFVIMEVKYDLRMPMWVRGIIEDFGLRRTGVSKYCTGIDACLLGDNRRAQQHELRARHFTPAFIRG